MQSEVPTVCRTEEAGCVCINVGCDGVHVCECSGSWEIKDDGEFVIHKLPPIPWMMS